MNLMWYTRQACGWGTIGTISNVIKERSNELGFDLYLVDIPGLLDTPGVYGYPNDTERFLAFQIAVLDWINEWQHQPDVIHCHDHHTGLIPFLLSYGYKYERLKSIPTSPYHS